MLSFASVGTAAAQSSPGCDTTGTVNGTATPTYGTVGTTIQFRATGFTVGEDVSFFFTLPNGNVFGTANPVPLPVNADGSLGPLPFEITDRILAVASGRWAVTFVGARSNNTSVIYFCILTTAQATQVAQPTVAPTNTAVPPAPTNTTAPVTEVATAQATETVLPTTQPTAPPPPTTAPTEVTPPTVAVPPTLPPVVEATETPVVVGMPRTGQTDASLYVIVALVALSLFGVGWMARRATSNSR